MGIIPKKGVVPILVKHYLRASTYLYVCVVYVPVELYVLTMQQQRKTRHTDWKGKNHKAMVIPT